jgi:DNA-binding transcriptional LysR family regulator
MNVTLRHLRAFATIAQLNSFVEASRVLHVTQASLSTVMRQLEDEVGLRLLERTTRRVRLSDAGRQFMPYAQRVLAAVDDAQRCAADLRTNQAGVVRIAATQVVAWTLMARPLARFRELHPGIRVMPVDVPVENIRSTIETGEADMAISTRTPVDAHIEAIPLFRSRIHVVCPPDHRFAARDAVAWRDLLAEPLIFTGQHSLVRLKAELNGDFEPAEVREVGTTTAALGLVAAGVGIAVSPGYVKPMTAVHDLRMIRCRGPVIVRQYMLFTDRRRAPLPAVTLHHRFLIDYFSRMGRRCVEDVEARA